MWDTYRVYRSELVIGLCFCPNVCNSCLVISFFPDSVTFPSWSRLISRLMAVAFDFPLESLTDISSFSALTRGLRSVTDLNVWFLIASRAKVGDGGQITAFSCVSL